jgi:pimeloyl-ACP methyl ester carboxylesterase
VYAEFLKEDTTQAFVFTDRAENASVVVVAFRGTEPFNMQDWSTDVNLSWLGMGAMGHVHTGFLKALGLQEEDGADANRAFPKDAPNGAAPIGKTIAYYKLREVIREQLNKHPESRLVVTGHSLGGALAAIFPALLALHKETDILARLGTVQTYGQPRVGDDTFVKFVRSEVEKAAPFYRIVYRYDVVPRVPFDIPLLAEYAHGGTCVYYDGWYDGKVLAGDVPNPNYFDPRYLLSMYGNALGDLVKGAFLWVRAGEDYREGPVSLLYGASGLIIPGLASHSPRDYVNGVRLGRIAPKHV